ncbi:hypothetical protein LLG10_02800 [bacterium]|nr:hypothetical protein [bacterium]
MKKKITVIGCGYVGIVTSIGFSEIGYNVICTDKDPDKINNLQSGTIPFYEPGLNRLRTRNVIDDRLIFSKDIKESIKKADIVIIAVETTPLKTWETDLSQIKSAVQTIIESICHYQLIIMKNIVPPGTNHLFSQYVKSQVGNDFDWISNPEFFREGNAVQDFFSPERIVIGHETQTGKSAISQLFRTCYWLDTPFLYTDFTSSELIYYASNPYLGKYCSISNLAQQPEKFVSDHEWFKDGIGLDAEYYGSY